MSKIPWLPGVVFGCLLWFVVWFFVFNLALRFINSNAAAVFWVTLVVCVIWWWVIWFWKEEEISIVSTSVVWAYAITRAISLLCGHFPDERQVYELSMNWEWDQLKNLLDYVVYAYLAVFLVLSAAWMFIQFKFFYDWAKEERKKEKEKKEKDKEENLVKNDEIQH